MHIVILAASILLLEGGLSLAQEAASLAQDVERGLILPKLQREKGVAIVIEQLGEKALEIGLTEEILLTRCELRFGQAGIPVDKRGVSSPCLYVTVSAVGAAFAVEIQFRRRVTVETAFGYRESMVAATWDKDHVGMHADDPEFIVQALDNMLDNFLTDFFKANPKK